MGLCQWVRGIISDQKWIPALFYHLANRFLTNEKNPEGFRSAISRAYYAAFDVAAEFLNALGCEVPRDASGHKRTCYYLNNCGDQTLILAGSELDLFRDIRNVADYRLDRKEVEKEPVVQRKLDGYGEPSDYNR